MELSFFEIVLIGVIAFLVLGPTEMIRLSHQLGKWFGKIRTEARNFRIVAEEQLLKADQNLQAGRDQVSEIEKSLSEKVKIKDGL